MKQAESTQSAVPAGIASLAAGIDAQLDGTAEQQQADQADQAQAVALAVDQGEDIGAMLELAVGMTDEFAPYIGRTCTPAWCQQHGALIAAVAQKRGWDLKRFMEPEYVLAGSLLMTTLKVSKDAKSYYAWLENQQRQAAQAQAPAPATAETVTDGG